MAKKTIRWTKTADRDKQRILKYWINRNKSTVFSEKLDILFDEAIDGLLIHPQLGKKSDFQNIRIKLVRYYLIYYLIEEEYIEIIRIWDPRNDPKKFKLGE